MSIESFAAMMHLQNQPPAYFVVGCLMSLVICFLAVTIESQMRRREIQYVNNASVGFNYQRFQKELASSQRHLDFANRKIHEIGDNDFVSE